MRSDFKIVTSHDFQPMLCLEGENSVTCEVCGYDRALHHRDEDGRPMPIIKVRPVKGTKAWSAWCRICPQAPKLGSWHMMMIFANNHLKGHF